MTKYKTVKGIYLNYSKSSSKVELKKNKSVDKTEIPLFSLLDEEEQKQEELTFEELKDKLKDQVLM